MQMLPIIALTAIAAATGAPAADSAAKTMRVPLAEGSTVMVEYYGDVAPRVTVVPVERTMTVRPLAMFPDFAGIDQMIADMNRRGAEMMRRMETVRRTGGLAQMPGMNLASAGSLPAGASSVSVVSVSNGGKTCTRTTEIVSQGAGKSPKVTSNVSGDCGPASSPRKPTEPTA